MIDSDDGFGHPVDIVSGSHTGDEIAIHAVGCSQATFKRSVNGPSLHSIGDINVGNLDAPRTGCLHTNGYRDDSIAVFRNMVVEGIDQCWRPLHDVTNR